MRKTQGYEVDVAVPLYTARELKAQFGIERSTLDMLENMGVMSSLKLHDTGRKQYNLAEVKLGLAVLARSLPTDETSAMAGRITPLLGDTPGWTGMLRNAIAATRGLPASKAADALMDIITASLATAAVEQSTILIPGVGKLTLKHQKARTYNTRFSNGPVDVEAHARWRFSMSKSLTKAVRQRTTKKR